MATTSDSTRLASAILSFLRGEMKEAENSPDRQESLEVAIQCIKLAYEIEEEEPGADTPNLLDIFVKAVPPPKEPEPLTEEEKNEAERLKKEGNDLMKKEMFDDAIKSYAGAIKIDPRNAVYYCNRAAAHTGLGNHEFALSDCRKAISIDKKYSKAYSRMGLTYSKLGQYEMAVECYESALKLDPENQGYKNNMQIAKDKIAEMEQSAVSGPGLGAMGGLGGMADMMKNPMFMNMAQQVLANPDMQKMAMNMMSSFMGPQGGAGGTSGESQSQGPPDMANLLQMGQQFAAQVSQENPELVNQLRGELNKPQENGEKKENPE